MHVIVGERKERIAGMLRGLMKATDCPGSSRILTASDALPAGQVNWSVDPTVTQAESNRILARIISLAAEPAAKRAKTGHGIKAEYRHALASSD